MSGQDHYNSGLPTSSTWLDSRTNETPRRQTAVSSSSSTTPISHNLANLEPHGSSSSVRNNANASRSQEEGQRRVSSSPSTSTSATTPQSRSARVRVGMACIHCRQRKIRCDGQQPTCSTCFRLGRYCVYESISEVENLLARDKKRRSKEVKQSRLKSLQNLGIPIPANPLSVTGQGQTAMQTSLSSGPSSSSSTNRGGSSMGVIRDSRLIRQERSRPYSTVHSQPPSPMYPPDQQQQNLLRLPSPPPRPASLRRNPSDSLVSPESGRRRGVTMDSYPVPLGQTEGSNQESSSRIETSEPISFTSLSQPTTPEATYSMHASLLSRELSSQQNQSLADYYTQPTSTPFYHGAPQSSTIDKESSHAYRAGVSILQGTDYNDSSPTYQSANPSTSSRSSAGDATMATSLSSVSQATNAVSPAALQRFMAEHPNLEAQLALRRRSSFDVGDFWRRTSVADAAVANFFDRVVQARGSRKSSTESFSSPVFRRFAAAPHSASFASSSSVQIDDATLDSSMSAARAEAELNYPLYSNFQQVGQDSTPLTTTYSSATNSNPVFSHPFGIGESSEHLSQGHGSAEEQQSTYSSPALTIYDTAQFAVHDSVNLHQDYREGPPLMPASSSHLSVSSHRSGMTLARSNSNFSNNDSRDQRSDQSLHLGTLPDFQTHRQYQALPTGGSNSGSAPPTDFYSSPHSVGVAGGSSYEADLTNNQNVSYFFRPNSQSTSIAPPLPTPMTDLSSSMFAMVAPSNTSPILLNASPRMSGSSPSGGFGGVGGGGTYAMQSYYQDESGQLQHPMAGHFDNRQASFSSSSIQEEEEEERRKYPNERRSH